MFYLLENTWNPISLFSELEDETRNNIIYRMAQYFQRN